MRWSKKSLLPITAPNLTGRLPGVRSGVSCRALLGAAMVSRNTHKIAYWDLFAHPEKPPRYSSGVGARENWWLDADKTAKAEQAK